MHEIPRPEVLNPARIEPAERDTSTKKADESVTERLADELRETCAYAQALWEELSAVRQYLVRSLPAPSAPGELGGASPTGRDDTRGWQAWTDIYAGVVSTLAGPGRDSGFALDEARQIARARLEFGADQRPTLETIEGRARR